MCHDSCCLIVLNIVLILYFFYFCGSPRCLGLPLVAVTVHGGCSRVNMLARLAHGIPRWGVTAQTFDTSPCDDDVRVFYISV